MIFFLKAKIIKRKAAFSGCCFAFENQILFALVQNTIGEEGRDSVIGEVVFSNEDDLITGM